MTRSHWALGPFQPILSEAEIHVWRLRLPLSNKSLAQFQSTLSPEEENQSKKFYFKTDQERYLSARGGLRNILSRYLSVSPKEIPINYGKWGKPFLENDELYFNLSHAGEYVLYAISNQSQIGVDVEFCDPSLDFLALAKQFFSKNEYEILCHLPTPEQKEAFYRCWVRKEAFIKAIGKGVHFPLDQFEVNFLEQKSHPIFHLEQSALIKDPWILEELEVGEDYKASIATAQSYEKVFLWDF